MGSLCCKVIQINKYRIRAQSHWDEIPHNNLKKSFSNARPIAIDIQKKF